MKNHQQEVLEIIDGFKNLTYKIKKDNDEIRDSIKNKDETIACCKTEYQKLYAEYKDLQKRYNELEAYILQEQEQQQQREQQQQQQQRKQQKYREVLLYPNKKRKHYMVSHDDSDKNDEYTDNDTENDDFEYVKIKKTKPKKKVKKKRNKGIMEYINDN